MSVPSSQTMGKAKHPSKGKWQTGWPDSGALLSLKDRNAAHACSHLAGSLDGISWALHGVKKATLGKL